MKLDVLGAASIVPVRQLRAANAVRQVRNEFAHRVDCATFDEVEQKYKDRLRSVFEDIYSGERMTPEYRAMSIRQQFEKVAFFALSGISMYRPNVQLLRKNVAKPEFENQLREQSVAAFYEHLDRVMSKPPISTVVENGLVITSYEEGFVNVRTQTPDEEDSTGG